MRRTAVEGTDSQIFDSYMLMTIQYADQEVLVAGNGGRLAAAATGGRPTCGRWPPCPQPVDALAAADGQPGQQTDGLGAGGALVRRKAAGHRQGAGE